MRQGFRLLGAAAVILAAAALLYGRATRNEKLPEDDLAIWGNPAVTGTSWSGVLSGRYYDSSRYGLRAAIRPVPVLWHRLEWRWFHEKRAAYVWVRAVLAALCAGALLRVLRAHGHGWRSAGIGSLILLAHPLTARSVLSVAGSADLLALLLGLTSYSLLVRPAQSNGSALRSSGLGDRLAAGACLFLAVLSHEVAIAFGVALLLEAILRRKSEEGRRGFGAAFVIGAALGLALVYRAAVLSTLPAHLRIGPAVESASGLDWPNRVLTGFAAIPEVARQMFLPLRLPYQHDFLRFDSGIWPRAALGFLLLAGAVALSLRVRRTDGRTAFWGLTTALLCLSICGILVPTGSLLPARPLSLVLAGVIVWTWASGQRAFSRVPFGGWSGAAPTTWGALALSVLLLCFFAGRTVLLGRAYESWDALVGRQTREFPRSAQSWFDLGNLALGRGRSVEAVSLYEKSLEIWPEYWPAWVNLGTAYGAMDEPGLAVRAFDKAIQGTRGVRAFRTVEARAYFNRALMLMKQSRNVEAAEGFEKMLEVFPDHLTAHANLGLIYSNSEHLDDKSTLHLNRALELETDPKRRQILEDFLEAIRRRRAGIERERQRTVAVDEFEADEPAPAIGEGTPGGADRK